MVALIGVGWQGGLSSHIFPDVYHGWISSHWLFLFNKVYSITLDICLLCLISRVLCGNSPEGSSLVLRRFQRGFQGITQIIPDCSCAILLVFPIQSTRCYLLLSPGLWLSDRSSASAYFGLLVVPKFPILLGVLQSSLKYCSQSWSSI